MEEDFRSHRSQYAAAVALAMDEAAEESTPELESPFLKVVDFNLYSVDDIVRATDNFHPSRLVGEGSNAQVFQGTLDGTPIAVKRFRQNGHSTAHVSTEIQRLAAINHRNIEPLQGFALEEGNSPLLVCNKFQSLDRALCQEIGDDSAGLGWEARCQIALGVAKGLAYLHSGARNPMVHSGIKPSNILFHPSTLHAFIADFGLAQILQGRDNSERNIQVSTRSDVYSFGELLYALVCSRNGAEGNMPRSLTRGKIQRRGHRLWFERLSRLLRYVCPWIRMLLRRNMLKEMDPALQGEVKRTGRAILQASTVLRLIVLCTQDEEEARPSMERVAMELESANLCDIPLSIRAVDSVGFRWSEVLGAVIYAAVVIPILSFFAYITCKMVPHLGSPKAIPMIISHTLMVCLVLHLTMVRVWRLFNGMDELLYWGPNDCLRLGWKRYHRLN